MRRIIPLLAGVIFASSSIQSHAQGEQFNLVGTTVYEPAELLSYAAQIVVGRGQAITADRLAQTVQQLYREDGYFLAEVFIARDGQTLVVNEGQIGSVSIEGVDGPMVLLMQNYVRPVTENSALNLREFERAIMLVEDIGNISANAEFDYPDPNGPARLRIIAEETDDSFGAVTLDHPARELGEVATLTFSQTYLSTVMPGDLLRFELSGTSDFGGDDSLWGAATFRTPIGGSGAYAELFYGNINARRDAKGALLATDIKGDTAVAALGYPVIRDVETYGYALAEIRQSGTEVDVSGSVFDSAVEVIGLSWIFGKALPLGGAYEYALNVSAGRRSTPASGFDDGDEDFAYLRLGFGYEHPTGWFGSDSTVRAEFWGQYSSDRLPSVEEFHLGGRYEERGYLFAEAVGDSGVSATLEMSRDLFPDAPLIDRLRPFGFLDVGYVSNNSPGTVEVDEETFASLGLGIEAATPSNFIIRSYVASPLTNGADTDVGDATVYFGVTKSW